MHYHQLYDGDWTFPRKTNYRLRCCDCGLVHILDFQVDKRGNISFRTRRDDQATRRYRKRTNTRVLKGNVP